MSTQKTTNSSDFGERLKFFRKARGMTQAQMAVFIGVANDTLSRYERGEITPSIDILVKILNALAPDVSADDLLFPSGALSPKEINNFGIVTGLTFYGNEGSVTVAVGFSEIRKLLKYLQEVELKSETMNQKIIQNIDSIIEHFWELSDDKINIQANVPIGRNAIKFSRTLSKRKLQPP